MKLLRARHVVFGGGMASLSLALCSGFEMDQVQSDLLALPTETHPAELETPLSMRSVEDWARIASATNQSLACLNREMGGLRRIGDEELQVLTLNLVNGCFARQGSSDQGEQVDSLPFTYAIHGRTGLPLELAYVCGCVVPTRCSVFARFAEVRQDECCQRGGVPMMVDALGPIYAGCVPLELASSELRKERCQPNDPTPPARSRFASAIRSDTE